MNSSGYSRRVFNCVIYRNYWNSLLHWLIALARNKLNIIETLMFQALIDFKTSRNKMKQDEFSKIIDEKIKYEGIQENINNIKNINDAVAENNQITSV